MIVCTCMSATGSMDLSSFVCSLKAVASCVFCNRPLCSFPAPPLYPFVLYTRVYNLYLILARLVSSFMLVKCNNSRDHPRSRPIPTRASFLVATTESTDYLRTAHRHLRWTHACLPDGSNGEHVSENSCPSLCRMKTRRPLLSIAFFMAKV